VLAVADRDRVVSALREAITAIRPPHPPTSAEIDRVLEVAAKGSRRAELDGGLVVLADRSWLRIGPLPEPPPEAPLTLPMAWGGFRFGVGEVPGGLGSARVPTDVVVRSPRTSDRIAIAGGHKDVADAFAEAGIPRGLRPAWPVVASGDVVHWIPLVRRAAGSPADPDRYLVANARSEEAW